jgi:hypothetical protein
MTRREKPIGRNPQTAQNALKPKLPPTDLAYRRHEEMLEDDEVAEALKARHELMDRSRKAE